MLPSPDISARAAAGARADGEPGGEGRAAGGAEGRAAGVAEGRGDLCCVVAARAEGLRERARAVDGAPQVAPRARLRV